MLLILLTCGSSTAYYNTMENLASINAIYSSITSNRLVMPSMIAKSNSNPRWTASAMNLASTVVIRRKNTKRSMMNMSAA